MLFVVIRGHTSKTTEKAKEVQFLNVLYSDLKVKVIERLILACVLFDSASIIIMSRTVAEKERKKEKRFLSSSRIEMRLVLIILRVHILLVAVYITSHYSESERTI